jgi:chlorobactene glucosyltransferase
MSPGCTALTLSTTFFLAGIVIIAWLHAQYHLDLVVTPTPPPTPAPSISVIVPARDEARNIRRCVESLLAQAYPNYEVIVLDDRSTDSTPAILGRIAASDPRLKVIRGDELPKGWAGKPHALHQAAQAARGEWLCFVDADTFVEPEALASTCAKAIGTQADLFTIMTRQIMGTFWERTVLPLVMTALSVGFSPRNVNDPERRDAVANGQFILIRRSVYDAVGGYERIKDRIVEDKALSELVKWTGHRLVVADGRHVARTRMYTSLPEMWEGWTKNIYLGLRDRPGLLLLGASGATLSLVAALLMPVWPLLGFAWWLRGGGVPAILIIAEALLLWAFLIALRARVARRMGISGWYALTTPLGAAVFAGLMLASAWKVLSGRGVTWKGRRYDLKDVK